MVEAILCLWLLVSLEGPLVWKRLPSLAASEWLLRPNQTLASLQDLRPRAWITSQAPGEVDRRAHEAAQARCHTYPAWALVKAGKT